MKQNETNKKTQLTPEQEKLVMSLLSCSSIEKAATEAGVSRSSAYRYLKDPKFKAELRRRRAEVADCALDGLKAYASKAVENVGELLESENESVKRKATVDVITNVLRVRELEDVEERLERLEKVKA